MRKGLRLFGCGTYGLLYKNGSVTISNCKIYHCSYGAICMDNVEGMIDDVEIYDCKNTLESIGKDRRDKIPDLKMFIEKLEKGRNIIEEHVLAV